MRSALPCHLLLLLMLSLACLTGCPKTDAGGKAAAAANKTTLEIDVVMLGKYVAETTGAEPASLEPLLESFTRLKDTSSEFMTGRAYKAVFHSEIDRDTFFRLLTDAGYERYRKDTSFGAVVDVFADRSRQQLVMVRDLASQQAPPKLDLVIAVSTAEDATVFDSVLSQMRRLP